MDAFNLKKVNMSLDDIIEKNKVVKKNFKSYKVDNRVRKDIRKILDKSKKKRAEGLVSKSILVTGLAPTVDQEDLENLFKPYGAAVKLHYREDGKFYGSAEIIAPSFGVAKQIYSNFNRRELDGYPMNIKFTMATMDCHESEETELTNLQVNHLVLGSYSDTIFEPSK